MRQQRTIQSSFYRHLHLGELVLETLLAFYPPGLTIPSCMQKGTNPSLYGSHMPDFLQEAPSMLSLTFYHVIIKSKGQKTIQESRKTNTALVLSCLTCHGELCRCTIPISFWTQLSGSTASLRVHSLHLHTILHFCLF